MKTFSRAPLNENLCIEIEKLEIIIRNSYLRCSKKSILHNICLRIQLNLCSSEGVQLQYVSRNTTYSKCANTLPVMYIHFLHSILTQLTETRSKLATKTSKKLFTQLKVSYINTKRNVISRCSGVAIIKFELIYRVTLAMSVTTSCKTRDNKWQRVIISANFLFFSSKK